MRILLFHSIHRIMKAERILLDRDLEGYRLIPTPRTLRSNCGLAMLVESEETCLILEAALAEEGLEIREKHAKEDDGYRPMPLLFQDRERAEEIGANR